MNSITVAVLLFAIIKLCTADEDGQYRPEKYGDDGKYRGLQDDLYYNRYRNYYGRDSQFFRYDPYFQQYNKNLSPYQRLRTEQEATAVAGVTARPPVVVSTSRPFVFATPKTVLPIYKDSNERYARIVSQESDSNDNSYHYRYLTENGIAADESGVVDGVNGGTRVSGFYEYIGDNGLKYRVDYTADENGFHPIGAHLP